MNYFTKRRPIASCSTPRRITHSLQLRSIPEIDLRHHQYQHLPLFFVGTTSVNYLNNNDEREYQYFIEGYVFDVKGNHFLVRCCVDLVSLWGNTT